MLAGTQQSVELKLALDQEQQKSKKLEESMRKLDDEMRRTDELLYQMIPKQVADRLRRGENPIDTCEVRIFSHRLHCVGILNFFSFYSPLPSIRVVTQQKGNFSDHALRKGNFSDHHTTKWYVRGVVEYIHQHTISLRGGR